MGMVLRVAPYESSTKSGYGGTRRLGVLLPHMKKAKRQLFLDRLHVTSHTYYTLHTAHYTLGL